MKHVTTLIRRSPFNSVAASEALRMSLGLTLKENKVTIVFMEDGVYLLTPHAAGAIGYPDVMKHLEALQSFDCRMVADDDSLRHRDLPAPKAGVSVMSRDEIGRILEQSERVIVV